jgi:secreted trypsin-like serine protease
LRGPKHRTAGHCLPEITLSRHYKHKVDLAWARVGIIARDEADDDDYFDNPDSSSSEEDFVVLRALRHPKYQRYGDDEFSYDYSIVQLNGTSKLQYVSLLRDESLLNETTHPYLTAMGLGWTQPDRPSKANWLHYVDLAWVNNNVCEEASYGEESYRGRIDPSHLCTFEPGKDSCNYDSGSPIVLTVAPTAYERSDSAPFGLRDFLVAQVSWGMECADANFPAVNARLSAVIDWIDSTVCKLSVDPPADFGCSSPTTTTANNATDTPANTANGEQWYFSVGSVDSVYVVIISLLAIVSICWHRKRKMHDYKALEDIGFEIN